MTPHPSSAATLHGVGCFFSATAYFIASCHHSLPFLTLPPTFLILHAFSVHPTTALLNSCHSSSTSHFSLSQHIPMICNSLLVFLHFLIFVQLPHFQNPLFLPHLSSLYPLRTLSFLPTRKWWKKKIISETPMSGREIQPRIRFWGC